MILISWLGWTTGTLLGSVAGKILPAILTGALGIMLYAMFIAIITPAAKAHKGTCICIICAIVLSFLFEFLPPLKSIPHGMVIVILTVVLSAIFAFLAPVSEKDPWEEEERV